MSEDKAPSNEDLVPIIQAALARTRKAPWRFQSALEIAAELYPQDKQMGAALAVQAALEFAHWSHWSKYLIAPLMHAADSFALGINPEYREIYVEAMRLIKNLDPSDNVEVNGGDLWFTTEEQKKILGAVVVELQVSCKVRLEEALRSVVGRDPEAAKKLNTFRNNLKRLDTAKGGRRVFYDLIHDYRRSAPSARAAADRALQTYMALFEGKNS
jgi:hypothetical protein